MYAGGQLFRLISDNLYNQIDDSLRALHWFDSNRRHKAITFLPEPIADDAVVEPNLITLSEEDVINDDAELGSNLSVHSFLYYVDIYGESKALALNLAGDIKDILDGRLTSIGRDDNRLDVYDLTQATPPFLFSCEINNVALDRNRYYTKPHQKHWWIVSFTVEYAYFDESMDY